MSSCLTRWVAIGPTYGRKPDEAQKAHREESLMRKDKTRICRVPSCTVTTRRAAQVCDNHLHKRGYCQCSKCMTADSKRCGFKGCRVILKSRLPLGCCSTHAHAPGVCQCDNCKAGVPRQTLYGKGRPGGAELKRMADARKPKPPTVKFVWKGCETTITGPDAASTAGGMKARLQGWRPLP